LVFGGVKNNAALEERCQSEENAALDGSKKKSMPWKTEEER